MDCIGRQFAFFSNRIAAIRSDQYNRQSVRTLEVVIGGLQLLYEGAQRCIILDQSLQIIDTSWRIESNGKNMDRNKMLSLIIGHRSQHIYLTNLLICDGDAPDGYAASMDVDLPAGLQRIAEYPVGGIGIVQSQRQIIAGIGIEIVDVIKALRHLVVALQSLGAQVAGQCTNPIGLE